MAEQPQPQWFKSSYSGSPNNECVECVSQPHTFVVRDSKNPDGPRLSFTHEAWGEFTRAVRTNDFVRR